MLTSPIKDEVLFDPLTSYWLLARREWWMYPFPALLKCRQDYCTHLPEIRILLSSLAHVAGIWGCGSLSFFAITTGLIGGLGVNGCHHEKSRSVADSSVSALLGIVQGLWHASCLAVLFRGIADGSILRNSCQFNNGKYLSALGYTV